MKFTLHESKNWEAAWNISQHPDLFDKVTNDTWGSEPPAVRMAHMKFLVERPANVFLVATNEAGETVGGFLLDQVAPGTYEVHTMLLPVCRGKDAIAVGKAGARWMFEHRPDTERLISQCPMNHREILFFALKCGFRKAGLAALSWLKAGIPWPLQTVEFTRKDLETCH